VWTKAVDENLHPAMISAVDAGSFRTDAYFKETQLASIQEGDPANIKLGSSQRRRPLTGSIYRPLHRGR
jgi:multidrug resistance efflux pump